MSKNSVKIILIVTDTKRKSLVFVDENLRVYSLQEAIKSTQNGLLKNVYTVNRSGNFYLRSTPSSPKEGKLDRISISSHQLFYSLDDIGKILSIPAFKNYWQKYQQNLLQEQQEKIDAYIIIDGSPRVVKTTAKFRLTANKDIIFAAAEKFDVDSYLLAAIIIDEIARLSPFEEIADLLAGSFVGKNTSGGIAQVKTDTARGLMLIGCYNPDPNKFSSKEKIKKASRQQIYSYVKESKHSIFFGAARIRYFIDRWKKFIDLSKRPEIIATLYSPSRDDPKNNPQPNLRGLQIANEFYKLAQDWLK
ncbi:MAG: hypothetical protein AAB509_01235 [Patescibacteria group bacterium]